MNNFEKIKAMNIDEFAKYWGNIIVCIGCPTQDFCTGDVHFKKCPKIFKQWLES